MDKNHQKNDENIITDEMFTRIIEKAETILSQHKDDKELTSADKKTLLADMLKTKKLKFLTQFGKYLILRDLELDIFKNDKDSDISYYVNYLKDNLINSKKYTKNHYFNYMNKVLKAKDFFTDKELERRNPLLYKQYIGQYAAASGSSSAQLQDETFSKFIFSKMDRDWNAFRCDVETQLMEEREEENEEESSGDEEEFKQYLDEKIPVTEEEKKRLRKEFLSIMESRFIEGEDEFNYSEIEQFVADDKIREQDMEDSYFDNEEPC